MQTIVALGRCGMYCCEGWARLSQEMPKRLLDIIDAGGKMIGH